jgi:hypothetical protein
MCLDKKNTLFLVSVDDDDPETNDPNFDSILSTYENVIIKRGISHSKIHAVNRDLDVFDNEWDVVLLASDDMIPQMIGYDQIIRDNMKNLYPNTDGVLWFNDGYQGDRLNTLCILGKKYYERFNYIYHPDYKSCWSDNEFMEVGNILGKQTYINQVIIRHEHPDWGYGSIDYVHNNNVKDWHHDNNVFQQRKSNNFYI